MSALGRESGKALLGLLRLGNAHEIAGKLLAKAVVTSEVGARGIGLTSKVPPLTDGGLGSLPHNPHRAVSTSAAGFLRLLVTSSQE